MVSSISSYFSNLLNKNRFFHVIRFPFFSIVPPLTFFKPGKAERLRAFLPAVVLFSSVNHRTCPAAFPVLA